MDKSNLEIITTSIEAAVLPDLWHKTLDLYVDRFGCKSGGIVVLDEQYNDRLPLAASRFIREDALEMYQKAMSKGDADDSVAMNAVFRSTPNIIRSELELFNQNELNDLPYSTFREWQREQFDIQHRYGLKLNSNGPWCDTMLLHVDSDKAQLSESDVSNISLLSHVMSSSLKTFRVMQQLQAKFNATLNALDKLGLATFLTINEGQVIHSNKSAQRLLDKKDGLALKSDGQLASGHPDGDLLIKQHCSSAYAAARAEGIVQEVVFEMKRPSENHPYLFVVNPMIDAASELESGLKMTIVFVVDPTEQKHISVEGLLRLGNLTDAEQEVCKMVVNGLTTEMISDRRGVEKNTIQQQIKQVLSKLNCKSRIDLMKLAVDTQLPLED